MGEDVSKLISRGLAGDSAAFDALYAAQAGRVKAYFLRSGFTAADADDLTQEVFIRVFKSLHTFDPARGSFGPWLAAISKNVARRRWQHGQPPQDFDPELADAMFADTANPGDSAALREEVDALSQCIDALPAELARIIHLRYVQGRTTRGVAAAAGIPEATVRLRLKEAAGLLELCLKGKGVFK